MINTTVNDGQGQAPVAIIGFGCAGLNAAIALRRAGYTGTVQVFSDTDTLPYSPILTSYFAGGEKTREECFPWSASEIEALELDLVASSPVEHIDIEAHEIRTAHGSYPYAKCIIASGSRPMAYGFPPADGYVPLMLRTMADADRLKSTLEDPACKRLLVSGASMVALKTLEAALNHGVHVTLVGMNPHVLDFNALPETAERFEKGLRGYGCELRLGMTIAAVERARDEREQGGKLQVTFSNGDVDFFDEISVSHGMRSNLEFLDEGALEMDRALLCDDFMRTSDPDVYAAGDVAQALELVSGQRRIVGIWKTAALQGEAAGWAVAAEMAGRQPDPSHAYPGAFPTNTIAVKDTLFISAGTMQLDDTRRVALRETDDMTVAYIFQREKDGSERLVGFNLTCDASDEGNVAYDTGAMLTLRIEQGCKQAR